MFHRRGGGGGGERSQAAAPGGNNVSGGDADATVAYYAGDDGAGTGYKNACEQSELHVARQAISQQLPWQRVIAASPSATGAPRPSGPEPLFSGNPQHAPGPGIGRHRMVDNAVAGATGARDEWYAPPAPAENPQADARGRAPPPWGGSGGELSGGGVARRHARGRRARQYARFLLRNSSNRAGILRRRFAFALAAAVLFVAGVLLLLDSSPQGLGAAAVRGLGTTVPAGLLGWKRGGPSVRYLGEIGARAHAGKSVADGERGATLLTPSGGVLQRAYYSPIYTANELVSLNESLARMADAVLAKYADVLSDDERGGDEMGAEWVASKRRAYAALRQGKSARLNDVWFAYQDKQASAQQGEFRECVVRLALQDGAAKDPASGLLADRLSAFEKHGRLCEAEANSRHWLHKVEGFDRVMGALQRHVREYLEAVGVPTDAMVRGLAPDFTTDGHTERIEGWTSVHKDGIRHPIHAHPDTTLAGTIYLRVPREGAGAIVWSDPRGLRYKGEIGDVDCSRRRDEIDCDDFLALGSNTVRVVPETGTIVLFPPWLRHQVEPTLGNGDSPRVAFSFNLMGNWGGTPARCAQHRPSRRVHWPTSGHASNCVSGRRMFA